MGYCGECQAIVKFERWRALKKDNEDAECTECRASVEETKYWYMYGEQKWGSGVQLCDKCFKALVDKNGDGYKG